MATPTLISSSRRGRCRADLARLTIVSAWRRGRRLVGTAVAVVLGVAFLTGTLVLGDTLKANFDRLFAEVSAGTDVVVRNATAVDPDSARDQGRGLIDASIVDIVRRVEGVAGAEAQILGYGSLIGRDGDAIGGNGPPRQAGSWITTPELNPYRLVEGRAPQAPDEVVVNRGAAHDGHLKVGDHTVVQTPQPVEVTIVGIATFGDADGLGQTTFTGFTLAAAQANVTRQPDRVSTILARAAPGVSAEALRDRIAAALPTGVEAITGEQLADERVDAIASTFLNLPRGFLIVFAMIALVVATLTINNTFSITIAQRTKELALLRAVGASRRQLRRSVSIEAAAVGLGAALVGVVAGLGVAGLLKGLFDAVGGALPAGGLRIRPTSIAIGIAVGVIVTLLAAQIPARRAAAVSPITALREVEIESGRLTRTRTTAGVSLVAAGLVATLAAAVGGVLPLAGLGALLLVVGALSVAPAALPPVAGALGGPLRRLRSGGQLAEENARRNPRRTAATATALVVGVAVVSLFTVLTASLKATLNDDVTEGFAADLSVNTAFFGGGQLSPRIIDELRALPEVARAVGVGQGPVVLDGDTTTITATDADTIDRVVDVRTTSGSLASLGMDGIAISTTRASEEDWSVGTTIDVTFSDGSTQPVTVRAVYDNNRLIGGVVVPWELWAGHTAQPTNRTAFIDTRPGVDPDAARQAIEPIAKRYGGDVQDRAEYASAATGGLDLLLTIIYALLALAVIIALLGIANSLSLAVYERRREIGLLRAVGQTRRQARSVLRLESIIVSSFGTAVGLALGGYLGWALFATVSDNDTTFALPIAQLAIVAFVGALAGVIAARRPARRAARLDILDALAAQ
jgi:putative ABC transport system permease protein